MPTTDHPNLQQLFELVWTAAREHADVDSCTQLLHEHPELAPSALLDAFCDLQLVSTALHSMPYSGDLLGYSFDASPASLADHASQLCSIQNEHSRRLADEREGVVPGAGHELLQLRSDRDALRRLLGTSS